MRLQLPLRRACLHLSYIRIIAAKLSFICVTSCAAYHIANKFNVIAGRSVKTMLRLLSLL